MNQQYVFTFPNLAFSFLISKHTTNIFAWCNATRKKSLENAKGMASDILKVRDWMNVVWFKTQTNLCSSVLVGAPWMLQAPIKNFTYLRYTPQTVQANSHPTRSPRRHQSDECICSLANYRTATHYYRCSQNHPRFHATDAFSS